MFREAVHTRCGHGVDIVTGRRFDIDGYKVHDIDGTLLTDDKIDKRLLSDQLLTRIPGKSDGYSYLVPDLGESSLVGYHSVDSGADRQGNFVSQAYVGDFTDVYPFTTFGDDATWDAKQTSESDYYKRIPTFGTYTKSAIGSRRFEMSDVAEFISHGNRNLLLRRLLSFIIDEFKKPIGKRRSVIIRDVSEHDIEMWVKAAELAFSPCIAASISFTTRIESLRSNFYTVDDRMRHDGIDLTRGDEFQRSMYMLVGVIDDEDGAPIIEIGHNQRYVMLDGKTMTQWITFDENLDPTLNSEGLAAWIRQLAAAQLDTVGTERSYTRPDGKVVNVSGGTYGWISDEAALAELIQQAVANKQTGEIEIPTKQTAAAYHGAGGRDWGAYVDIDISEQHVRYYDANDNLLWESGCITGNPNEGNDTPTGIYSINNLERDVALVGKKDPATGEPEYVSYVDYWMSFIGSAIGLHDADWQASSSFSDPTAYTWTGSHGCVNLPPDKAAELFGILQVGDCVIVHN